MARPRSGEARTKILDAAAALVLEVGVRAFTIDELSRRSGVAKTTIYRHFTSRNEIVVTALDGLTPVPAIPDTGSLRRDLIGFLENVRPIFADHQLRALFLDVFAAANLDPELAQLQGVMMSGRGEAMTTILGRAQHRGELSADVDFAEAFELLEGPMIVRSLGTPDALDQLDVARVVDRTLAVWDADRG